jgi:hypothetical protein
MTARRRSQVTHVAQRLDRGFDYFGSNFNATPFMQ